MPNRTILYAAALVGSGALIVVGALLASRLGGADADPTAALNRAACTYKVVRAVKAQHVNSLKGNSNWNTFPPSSGPHYTRWMRWGFYTAPVPLMKSVHNLEHGGIEIVWGDGVAKAQVDEVERFYKKSPNAMLGFPLPKLGNRIALVAWTQKPGAAHGQGRVATCTRFNQAAFEAFRDAFRGKGPERFPVELLRPGS